MRSAAWPKSLVKLSELAVIVAVSVGLLGCAVVTSKEPVGAPVTLDKRFWNSSWVTHGGKKFKTRVKDANSGVVAFYGVAKLLDDQDNDISDPVIAVVSSLGDCNILNFQGDPTRVPPDTRSGGYPICRISFLEARKFSGDGTLPHGELSDTPLVVFIPDVAKFRSLVSRGVLRGTLARNGDAELDGFSAGEANRLKNDGIKIQNLFHADPVFVALPAKRWP